MTERPRYYRLNPDHSVTPLGGLDAALKWAEAFEADRHVALTEVAPGFEVSTVFLGFDHNFLGGGPPLLFETMVFDDYGGGDAWRWSTWAEAEAGHQRAVVELTKRTVKQWAAKPDKADE